MRSQVDTPAPFVAAHTGPPAAITPAPRPEAAPAPVRTSPTAAASDGTVAPTPRQEIVSALESVTPPRPAPRSVRAARFQQIASAAPPVQPPPASAAPVLPSPAPTRTAATPVADAENAATSQSVLASPRPITQFPAPAHPPETAHVTIYRLAPGETAPPAFAPSQAPSHAAPPRQSPVPALAENIPPAAPPAVQLRPSPPPRTSPAADPAADPPAPLPVARWQLVRAVRAPAPAVTPQPWPALLEVAAPEEPSLEAVLRAQARRQRLDREQRGDAWNA